MGTGASWEWYSGSCGGTCVGTGSSIIVSPTSTTTYYVQADGTCNTTSCVNVAITVNTNSTAPTSITASQTTICSGDPVTLTVNGGSLGAGANWELYTGSCGGTFVSSNTTGSFSINPTSTTTYYVLSDGTCNTTTCASVTINITALPAAAGTITGPFTVCPSASGLIYSISSVTGATTYTWTVPTGWTINAGAGTTSISVTAGSAGQNGNISVTAGNSCGTSAPSTFPVVVDPGTPAVPIAITGLTPVCPGTSQTYSISAVTNATTYTWTVPTGWTITGGTGTTSITVTAGSTGQNGNISVTAGNSCGTSSASTLPVVVSPDSPAVPGTIVGSFTVCPNSAGLVYSITGVTGASTYTWTVPTGWTITGGNGTTSITVTSGTTGQNGTISVTAGNSCGTSAASTLNVSVTGTVVADVTISASQNPICANATVTFTATPINGGGTPSYQWYLNGSLVGFDSPTYVNSGLTSGDDIYCVMTSSEACATGSPATSSTITMTVNAPSTDPVSVSATISTICSGSSTDITVNGGSLGIGADWYWYEGGCGTGSSIGNGATINVSPTTTTVYYVRAEGTCNTTGCASVVVNVIAAPNAGTDGIVSICDGDPSINLFTELGGTPTGGGIWTNSGGTVVTNMFDPLTTAGDVFTYTVTGTAPCGAATATVTVTVDPLPIVSFTNLDSVYCGDGSTIILTGNQAPNGTYTGVDISDNGDGTADYTYVTPGTHNISYSYTNGFGCTSSEVQAVVVQSLPYVNFVGLDTAYCQGEPIDDITGNHPSGTYTGVGVTDNGDGTATFDPSLIGIQTITYEYTDANGCSDTDDQIIEVYPIPTISNVNVIDVSVCSAPYNGEISVSGIGGSGTYLFAIDGGVFGASSTFTGLNAGNYVISVEDDLGCSSDSTISVNSNTGFTIDSVEVSNVNCFGDSTGQLIIHAYGGVQFSIDNGVTYFVDSTFINLPAGTYNVAAQDTGSCTDISSVLINQNNEIIVNSSIVDVSCGGNNGSASLSVFGGTSPYTYLWSNSLTTSVINNLAEGTYEVTVTDSLGCSVFTSVTIGNGGGTLVTSITNLQGVDCFGDNNGTATVVVSGSGSYTYLWSNGDTTATISNLSGGSYYVTVEDLFGCQGIDTVYIQEPTQLTYSDSVTHVSCYGGSDGIIDLNISGGTPGYTYNWLPSGFTESGDTYSDLPPNTYAVTITDVNGCSKTIDKIDVHEPNAIEIHFSGNMPSCYGYSDGICYVSAIGGSSPYTYVWSEGTIGSTISNISTGEYYEYYVTATDANSCIMVDTLILPSLEQILYTEDVIDASCIGNNDGVITLQVYNGNSPFTFSWDTDPVQSDSIATGLTAGTYQVTITDTDGCEIVKTFDVLDGTITCIKIPTVFTPNGDGTNDKWIIEGIHLYPEVIVEIYNRWGDIIFESNGYNEPWDGTYNGKELPISSYVFIIDLRDGNEPIQGIVTIKK